MCIGCEPLWSHKDASGQKENLVFRAKMAILSVGQAIFAFLGLYVRPARAGNFAFIEQFFVAKSVGHPLVLIGNGSDGSYVIPDDLKDIELCFSPGVGPTSRFEEEIFDRYGIKSFLIDASVPFVPSTRTDFFHFEQKFLGAVDFENYISLDSWVAARTMNDKASDLILQMDIEGHEFASLLACSDETLKKFRIIALEIHFLDALRLDFFKTVVEQCLRKLDQYFVVCFARPNDCCGNVTIKGTKFPRVIEITLLRKDRILDNKYDEVQTFKIKNLE